MPELNVERFDDFLTALHHEPDQQSEPTERTAFPWQRLLLDELLNGHGTDPLPWPTAIDAPTALGKTSVLDVTVFAAAAGLPVRRVFFVVDRRIVVDEAYDHAKLLQDKVRTDAAGILGEVGAALARRTGQTTRQVITATRMRGGITWDWRWMDRPDRFGIVVGTVDQVGSRMLFRGYGLSDRLAPIDAALVGTDSVLFVDEAHLAQPMIDTIAAAQRLDYPEHPVCQPTVVVPLSATHRHGGDKVLRFDVEAHLAHSEAARRLRASKVLHTVTTTEKASAGVLAAAALAAAQLGETPLVGVIANTVGKARAIFERVQRSDGMHAVLLTGRQRPWDRDQLVKKWSPRLTVGWRATAAAELRPTILVATQSVEVGANIDLDALISESAPWDSLIQRLGRLNRVGAVARQCPAVIVHAEGAAADPVYGEPRNATWHWLAGLISPSTWKTERAATTGLPQLRYAAGLDVSPLAIRRLRPPDGATSTPRPTPILFPQHLEGWVRTGPVPEPDTPIAPFLHGFDDRRPAVRVIWRADLAAPAAGDVVDGQAWSKAMAGIPPRPEEELELPLPAVQAWLRHQPAVPLADEDRRIDSASDEHTGQQPHHPALRIGDREDDLTVVWPRQLRPGDRIVVPATYGGLDEFGWAPKSTDAALDVADIVSRRQPVIRLSRATLLPVVERLSTPGHAEHIGDLLDLLDQALPEEENLDGLPGTIPEKIHGDEAALPTILTDLAKALAPLLDRKQAVPRRLTVRTLVMMRPAERLLLTRSAGHRGADSTVGSSASNEPVLLDVHHHEVADLACDIADKLRLPELVRGSVRQAAAWHDLGKLDPRFQAILFGGSALNAESALLAGQPRAKSGIDPADWRARRHARRASGYPASGRHEALSAALAHHRLAARDLPVDADLVEHLIAAHHGHSRPLLPAVHDPNRPRDIEVPAWALTVPLPDDYNLDWTSPRRFRRLCNRYGIWGLALLETIVRLADIACSAGESGKDDS